MCGQGHSEVCMCARLYVGFVECFGKGMVAFYFRPNADKFTLDKLPVGINKLNQILPDMCKAAG